MAMFDWNHDGKKDYVDTAIEMMVLDDIEAEKNGSAGDGQYTSKRKEESTSDYKGAGYFAPLVRVLAFLFALAVLIPNIIGIASGNYTIAGFIVGIGILVAIGLSHRKK